MSNDEWLSKATYWFQKHTELSRQFDTSLADYYSDEAYIQNTLVLDSGEQKHRVMPSLIYKSMIHQFMALAKDMGDTYDISNVEYFLENNRATVTYVRYSHLKDFSSPVKVVFGLTGGDEGIIFEEYSLSKG